MASDFDDLDTDGARQGAGTRYHALVHVDGVVTTKLLPASGDVKIGRAPSCDLVVRHVSVSRHHATLHMSPLQIVDEGSRNGTRVRGRTLPVGVPVDITADDKIQIGDAAILLQPVTMSFDGKPLSEPQGDVDSDAEARMHFPFAVVQIALPSGTPSDVLAQLRGIMRTTDVVKAEGPDSIQILLTETVSEHVGIAVARITELLRQNGITAQLGVARYPDDGVTPEQLLAHAYYQLARSPDEPRAPMDDVNALVHTIAGGELSVLINGETGVGKELCAETIHRLSPRATKPFVKLNCSTLVESLIESELFGHEKGAFTGATSAHAGLFETGNGGTVFLDEIGELPLQMQAKLLRVLEDRIVRRVGATAGKKVDVRFICATNRNLVDEVNVGHFRRDLYYRINAVAIAIPPLRERRNEIGPLARAFAVQARSAPVVLSQEVIAALEHHSWPGNIRELRNTIERAVLLSSGGAIRPAHLTLDADAPRTRLSPRDSGEIQTMPIERISYETIERPPLRPSDQSLPNELADLERQRIVQALEQCGGNQSRAAKLLGISRSTLRTRLDAYRLPRPRKT